MYEKKVVEFLKRLNLYSEDVLDFIKDKTIHINYSDADSREFIGCYPIMEDNVIRDIRLCVPVIEDDFTAAINVHEYIHLLRLYRHLDEEFEFTNSEEVSPVIFEILFLSSKGDKKFAEYLDYYKEYVENKKDSALIAFLEIYDDIIRIDKDNKNITK